MRLFLLTEIHLPVPDFATMLIVGEEYFFPWGTNAPQVPRTCVVDWVQDNYHTDQVYPEATVICKKSSYQPQLILV